MRCVRGYDERLRSDWEAVTESGSAANAVPTWRMASSRSRRMKWAALELASDGRQGLGAGGGASEQSAWLVRALHTGSAQALRSPPTPEIRGDDAPIATDDEHRAAAQEQSIARFTDAWDMTSGEFEAYQRLDPPTRA